MQYSRPLETRGDFDLWAPTFLAGQFGELVMLGLAGPGASQDNAMVMEQIRKFIPHEDQQRVFFQAAFEQARNIVQEREAAVQAVASALLNAQTLRSADAVTIIESFLSDSQLPPE